MIARRCECSVTEWMAAWLCGMCRPHTKCAHATAAAAVGQWTTASDTALQRWCRRQWTVPAYAARTGGRLDCMVVFPADDRCQSSPTFAWTIEKLVWDSHDHTSFCSSTCNEQNTACALLFTLFFAQFLVHFSSNGVDCGLWVRVITATAVRLWCLLVCLLVTSSPPLCDESTAWRVDLVTSWPCDELTGSLQMGQLRHKKTYVPKRLPYILPSSAAALMAVSFELC